jgi:hypothetical protein
MICALPVTVEPFQFSPAEPVAYELSHLQANLIDLHSVLYLSHGFRDKESSITRILVKRYTKVGFLACQYIFPTSYAWSLKAQYKFITIYY